MNEKLLVTRLRADAILPSRQSAEAAGMDLHALLPDGGLMIPPMGIALVSTGIAMRAPRGSYIRIAPRSGLSVKYGIMVLAGVVDRDYTGEIKVCLANLGDRDFLVETGMRIAQAVVEQIFLPEIEEVDALPETDRGSGGFGSTGLMRADAGTE